MTNLISDVLVLEVPYDDYIHRRFKEAFDSTWNRIASGNRKAIYKYLKGRPGRVFLCYIMDYQCGGTEPWGRICWYDHATLFTFDAAFVEGAQPLEGVCSVIAHELAHCYRKALSIWTPIEDEEERGVREVTKAWGFRDPVPQEVGAFAAEIEDWRSDYKVTYGKYKESYIVDTFGSRA